MRLAVLNRQINACHSALSGSKPLTALHLCANKNYFQNSSFLTSVLSSFGLLSCSLMAM